MKSRHKISELSDYISPPYHRGMLIPWLQRSFTSVIQPWQYAAIRCLHRGCIAPWFHHKTIQPANPAMQPYNAPTMPSRKAKSLQMNGKCLLFRCYIVIPNSDATPKVQFDGQKGILSDLQIIRNVMRKKFHSCTLDGMASRSCQDKATFPRGKTPSYQKDICVRSDF